MKDFSPHTSAAIFFLILFLGISVLCVLSAGIFGSHAASSHCVAGHEPCGAVQSEHMGMWSALFRLLPSPYVLAFFAAIFIVVGFLPRFDSRTVLAKPEELKLSFEKSGYVVDYLTEAFSRGILHPKIY